MGSVVRACLGLVIIAAGLAFPRQAEADTGWSPSWKEVMASDVIALADYRGRDGEWVVFDVVDRLKGHHVTPLRLIPNGDFPSDPHTRYLIIPDGKWLGWAFSVRPGGSVASVWTGAGEPHHYPRTLAGWYRALGLAPPDTSTASSPIEPSRSGQGLPIPILLASALLGVAASLRSQRQDRRRLG